MTSPTPIQTCPVCGSGVVYPYVPTRIGAAVCQCQIEHAPPGWFQCAECRTVWDQSVRLADPYYHRIERDGTWAKVLDRNS